jgi:hypothetical protein
LVFKLTFNRSEEPFSKIDVSLEGISCHTQQEETNLQEYIKGKLDVRDDNNGMDPLLKDRVWISQLIKDMDNVRSHDHFLYRRITEWLSPSGESLLLDEVFQDSEVCVEAIWKCGVSDEKCLLDKKDETLQTLTSRLENIDMFNEIYVHVGKEEERLSASTYPPRKRIYGTVHSENFQLDGCSVANLYHYPINNLITKSMCVPMSTYIYDFTKMVWERTRDSMPSITRYVPPNHCS